MNRTSFAIWHAPCSMPSSTSKQALPSANKSWEESPHPVRGYRSYRCQGRLHAPKASQERDASDRRAAAVALPENGHVASGRRAPTRSCSTGVQRGGTRRSVRACGGICLIHSERRGPSGPARGLCTYFTTRKPLLGDHVPTSDSETAYKRERCAHAQRRQAFRNRVLPEHGYGVP